MRARAAMCAGVLLAPATAPASAGTCARSRARVAVTRAHILWRAQRGGGNERDWPPERGAPAWPWWPQGGTGRLAATRRALPPVPGGACTELQLPRPPDGVPAAAAGSPLCQYLGGFRNSIFGKSKFLCGRTFTLQNAGVRVRVRVSE